MTLQQIIDAAEAAKTGGAANLGATPELVWELLQALAQNGGGGGGVSVFTGLTDVPSTYVGESGKLVAVKGDETGLEFVSAGGGNTLYTGDGQIAGGGGRIVDLNANVIQFQQGGQYFLLLDPTVNSEVSTLRAFNNTNDGSYSILSVSTTDVLSRYLIVADFNDGVNRASIQGSADAASSTLAYTADTHTFTGNVGIGVTPSADEVLTVVSGGYNYLNINKTNFLSAIQAGDGTAEAGLSVVGNSATTPDFDLFATDGINPSVEIFGNAIAQTITLTAANGIIFSNQARLKNYTVATLPAGTAGDIAYVTDALLPTFLATVAGSGAVVTPVFYDGSNWKSF